MTLNAALRSAIGFSIVAMILVGVVAALRGGAGFTWQSVLGAAAGGCLAGLVVEWVRGGQPGEPSA